MTQMQPNGTMKTLKGGESQKSLREIIENGGESSINISLVKSMSGSKIVVIHPHACILPQYSACVHEVIISRP